MNEQKRYMKESIGSLILCAIAHVLENGEVCSFERLVYECFTRFPERFRFDRYPQWPNAMILDRQLRTLREGGLITGNPQVSYKLTPAGEKEVEIVKQRLYGKGCEKKGGQSGKKRQWEYGILKHLYTDPSFTKFKERKGRINLDEKDVRRILKCTMETPKNVLEQNCKIFLDIVKDTGDITLVEFIKLVKEKVEDMKK